MFYRTDIRHQHQVDGQFLTHLWIRCSSELHAHLAKSCLWLQYELAGIPCLAAALWLNNQAAQALGAAWDRVIAPKELVTTGIYKHIQHPIYTSYMVSISNLQRQTVPGTICMLAMRKHGS